MTRSATYTKGDVIIVEGSHTSEVYALTPKGGRPRYTAGPRRRGKPKHSHRGHPVPGPWKRRSQAVRERKTSVLRPCRVPNPAKRLNVVQGPKTLFEPQRSMTSG